MCGNIAVGKMQQYIANQGDGWSELLTLMIYLKTKWSLVAINVLYAR
jgi:hypothetical protein